MGALADGVEGGLDTRPLDPEMVPEVRAWTDIRKQALDDAAHLDYKTLAIKSDVVREGLSLLDKSHG